MQSAVRFGLVCLLALAGAIVAIPAQAQAVRNGADSAAPMLTGKPVWTRQPSGQQISALRPARVVTERMSGGAVLDCVVTATGALSGCKVEREAPRGYGFGAAALKAAPLFRMAPATADGRATAGARVRAPVTFDARRVGGVMTVMAHPMWIGAPDLAAVQAAYPPSAGGASGKAVVRCAFDIEGRATDCELKSESPAGKGFGAAALGLADDFVLRHEAGDADILPGIVADIPFAFQSPEAKARRLPQPQWLTELTAAAAEDLFPPAAREAGTTSGGGLVNCLVDDGGGLTDCRVARERPSNLGFGDAALQAARLLVMSPWNEAGEPVAGRRVSVPIRLRLVTPPLTGKPVWLSQPTAKDLENLHPTDKEKPGAKGLSGGATLVCLVTAAGSLSPCAIENEQPKGNDFGAAVLETAPLWRMGPRASDGQTTAGTRVRVPVSLPAAKMKP